MIGTKLELHQKESAEFCLKWKIIELALFGSILREDFRPDSDVDVLVTFAPDAKRGLFAITEMQDELGKIFHREPHIASRHNVEPSRNSTRRKAILESALVVWDDVWSTAHDDIRKLVALLEPLILSEEGQDS